MDRRSFLKFLAPAAIGGVIAAEELLSTRTYFLPPPKGWRHLDVTYLDLSDFERRILQPAIEAMAKRIDAAMVDTLFYGQGLVYVPIELPVQRMATIHQATTALTL